MLLYKGWLETRLRLCIGFGFITFFFLLFATSGGGNMQGATRGPVAGLVLFTIPSQIVAVSTWLAGAGIVTQDAFRAAKGLHGSTLFTLSLPVSRLRLFATRALLGWLELTVTIVVMCGALWVVAPRLKAPIMWNDLWKYGITLVLCSSALYSLSVVFATFLDDQWRMWGTLLGGAALWWIPAHTSIPAAFDIFGAMSVHSPVMAHSVPWTTMLFSIALGAVLLLVALKIARAREY